MDIYEVRNPSDADWLDMRGQLWPEVERGDHQRDMKHVIEDRARFVTFIALDAKRRGIGFAEVSLRHDYVNGCETSPVAFLEGIFVRPESRRQGVARLLCEAAEDWGRSRGCSEFASDALIENVVSHEMHAHLGFQEMERVVCFKKVI